MTTRLHSLRRSAVLVGAVACLALTSAAPALAGAPPNDRFRDAVVADALPFVHEGDTRGATFAVSDPECVANQRSVWYRYTAEGDGLVGASVEASFDATLTVVTGRPGAWSYIACSDDPPGVTFQAVAGETYHVMVAVYGGGAGPITLTLRLPRMPRLQLSVVSARVFEDTGEAVLRLNVTCSRAREARLDSLQLRQRTEDGFIAFGYPLDWPAPFRCDGVTRSARVMILPENRAFSAGPARVIASLGACGTFGCTTERFTPLVALEPAS